ncbi:hypothetical protein ACLMAJ_32775 [Nocardia sp. KC 131]|uniref:hypothetical protein n=1 Tax=Nocardia arseniciresistens TaxID=3392119 RepID=UPI00398F4E8B
MPIRLPAPPRAGCTSGIPDDRHGRADGLSAARGSTIDRRTALRLAGGGTLGALALGAAAGCADDRIYEPDPLAAQETLARADAAAATAAIALTPQRHVALTTIASERTAHADALLAEITRVIGAFGDGTTPTHRTHSMDAPAGTGPSPAASGTAVPPSAPPTIDQLRDRLNMSQQSAADLARTQSAYRAGLLASISAACATEAGVLLA